jgi:hypothetical protein
VTKFGKILFRFEHDNIDIAALASHSIRDTDGIPAFFADILIDLMLHNMIISINDIRLQVDNVSRNSETIISSKCPQNYSFQNADYWALSSRKSEPGQNCDSINTPPSSWATSHLNAKIKTNQGPDM